MLHKPLKTHVITLSKVFLQGHPKAGKPTYFKERFMDGDKLHTIRLNKAYWTPKIKEVQDGIAQLSVRQWSEKPFRSNQEILKNLTADDGVGFQDCIIDTEHELVLMERKTQKGLFDYDVLPNVEENDSLSFFDFWTWFKEDTNAIIIHFTDFRY